MGKKKTKKTNEEKKSDKKDEFDTSKGFTYSLHHVLIVSFIFAFTISSFIKSINVVHERDIASHYGWPVKKFGRLPAASRGSSTLFLFDRRVVVAITCCGKTLYIITVTHYLYGT